MGQTKRTIRNDLLRSSISGTAAMMIAMTCLHVAGSELRPGRGPAADPGEPERTVPVTENGKPFFWLATPAGG